MEKDCCEWKLTTVDPKEITWRSGVRSANMHAANQLPEREPTDVNQKSYYDDDEVQIS